jgi:hypothetical protein
MAQYRVLEKSFINNMVHEKGDIVEYDGSPGSTLQPVETHSKVEIPDNWRDENGLKRIALAKSLGAPGLRLSAVAADQWIQNELDNRELAKTTGKTEKAAAPSLTDKLFTPKPAAPTPTPAAAVASTPPHDPSASN